MNHEENQPQRDIHFSKRIRAGKRTYYFDVKSTRNNDFYLTITESKRLQGESDAQPIFEKHKLFLYKEDFEKFTDGLLESLEFIKGTGPATVQVNVPASDGEDHSGSSFSNVDFDDLGK